MKHCSTYLIAAVLLWCCINSLSAQSYDTNSVILTRALTKDLFQANSVPFMQPLITSVNATSNARFFQSAKIPEKVSKPYFRFGVHTMVGFVRDDQRTFAPNLPTESDPGAIYKYFNVAVGLDTMNAMLTWVKRLFHKGIAAGKVQVPTKSATVLGSIDTAIVIDTRFLVQLLNTDAEFATYKLVDSTLRKKIDSAILKLPGYLTLPRGGNMQSLFAAVPQLEIGALWGTELMLRFIPPVTWDTTVGKFAFWGIALKHSLSRYFNEPLFDCAFQVGYQGTHLRNTVGATSSQLTSDATFWNINIHASKEWKGVCDFFTGMNYEYVSIASQYSFTLPQEMQIGLGLLAVDKQTNRVYRDSTHPGDDVVQTSSARFSDSNVKWTIGVSRDIGPVSIFADFQLSRFNIFSGGVAFRF